MRLTRRAAPLLLAGALLVLLPTLAILQYRWIGQVDDAARERVLRDLENSAVQFRVEFDRELARAFLSLQVTEATARGVPASVGRYADRYATWVQTALHPGLVEEVYLVPPTGLADEGGFTPASPRRWNAPAATFEDVPWGETPLRRWRERLERAMAFEDERGLSPIELDDTMLIGPLRATGGGDAPGLTVVVLDQAYLRDQWLPELAARYFQGREAGDYRVAVISARGAREVLYRTDPSAPLLDSQAEVRERLFAREDISTYAPVVPGTARVLEQLPVGISELGWSLLATHRGGPLEAAVARAHVRNLGISFGILLLLAGSVGLVFITSRREQQLARQQLELVAGISHELRTPVSVIQAAAANLSSGVVEGARVKTYGATIVDQARRLGDMVEGALQFARFESARPLLGHDLVTLSAIVEEAVAATRAALPADVSLEVACPVSLPGVRGDRAALVTAVQNLLVNAAKYGGADRWIGVRCESGGSPRHPEVRVTVEDHGPGVSAADRDRIFEPFYRGAVAAERNAEGSGLGLALVARIAEAHGGRVSLSTAPGSGCAFTLHLPVMPRDARDGSPAAVRP